jgi:hypothetical protein
MFTFAILAPGAASAFEINTATVGLTTAPMEFSEHTTESLYEGLTVDVEFDLVLKSGVPLLGSIVTDTRIKYGGVALNAPDTLTGQYLNWRTALYAQPWSWLRVGPIISQGESDRTIRTEYAIRIGKHF